MADNDYDETEQLGVYKISVNQQIKVPEEVLEILEVEKESLVGFKNCPEENTVKFTKAKADY